MTTWLVDSYRNNNKIILWLKVGPNNVRVEKEYDPAFYLQIDKHSKKFLLKNNIQRISVKKLTYMRTKKRVYAITTKSNEFEKTIRQVEHESKYEAVLYNADVAPEYQYMYKHNLQPFCQIESTTNIKRTTTSEQITLKPMRINISTDLTSIEADKHLFTGTNHLKEFADYLKEQDPDVLFVNRAFSIIPKLYDLLKKENIDCPLHRWDDTELKFKGGKSFFSYGKVKYHEFAVRLRGRFLVDTGTTVGDDCQADAIVELSQLSGMGFQQIGSRSYGAVFQFAVIRELFQRNMLVPYKEKPIDNPMHLLGLLKADRAGQTLDPKTGFHTDVAEIDFASMFPWLIYNYNISAESLLTKKGPFEKVPGTTIKISRRYLGITPSVIKPFIDRRMYYKANPSAINKERSIGLKSVLVSSYGYLRFREFKLGLASAHMAICAHARRILLVAIRLAQKYDFEVVHGIVDSVYIKKKGITKEEVKAYCEELHQLSGIPVSFEGIFKWICFSASVNDPDIPVPTKHFGIFQDGEVKARGIEVRERGKPKYVRTFQAKLIAELSDVTQANDIYRKLPALRNIYINHLTNLNTASAENLQIRVALGETNYTTNIPQKVIFDKYKKRGIDLQPGQVIYYVHTTKGPVLPEEYTGNVNQKEYQKLLFRALHQICQPFGIKRTQLAEFLEVETQTKLKDFQYFKEIYIPAPKKYENYRGVSETLIKRDLEKKGWIVWRGGLIHYAGKSHEYPNVQRKYHILGELLNKYHPDAKDHLAYICQVHHGMPDFICFKNNKFLFVECKLAYETVKTGQKICAQKLTELGFEVQIHRIVHEATKVRVAYVNANMKRAQILDKQKVLEI